MRFIGWRVVEVLLAVWISNQLAQGGAAGTWLVLLGIWVGEALTSASGLWCRFRSRRPAADADPDPVPAEKPVP